jgi:hypothetical protein
LQARRLHHELHRHVDLDLLRLDDADFLGHDDRFRRSAGAEKRGDAEGGQACEDGLVTHESPPVGERVVPQPRLSLAVADPHPQGTLVRATTPNCGTSVAGMIILGDRRRRVKRKPERRDPAA